MGKIGDLIVRLQLKHQDYQKGLKEAESDTKGFVKSLDKLKVAGLAVWGAIGGAVLKVASDMVKATNQMEDKWEMFTVKAQTAWNTFIKTLTNGNWKGFINQYKAEVIAAQYLTESLQNTTEVENSIRLQKASMAEELAALEVAMRDANNSYDERAAAAQKYLNKVKPIYDQEIKRLLDLKKANMALIGAGIYTPEQMGSANYMAAVEKFLIEYGKDTKHKTLRNRTLKDVIDAALVPLDIAPSTDAGIQEQRARAAAIEQLQWLSQEWFPKLDTNFLFNIAKNYEGNMNSEQVTGLVTSIAAYGEALSALDKETKRIQTLLAAAKKQAEEEAKKQADTNKTNDIQRDVVEPVKALETAIADVRAETAQEMPDIITEDWLNRNSDLIDQALGEAMRFKQVAETINNSIENSIISAISGTTQALMNALMNIEGADAKQVLVALTQPFAQSMVQIGEMLLAYGIAIEAFKNSSATLQGGVAIAAGLGLIVAGSALGAAITKLGGGSVSAGAGSASEVTSSGGSAIETYNQEITVHVVGEISGDKIVLVGQKTLNKWNR